MREADEPIEARLLSMQSRGVQPAGSLLAWDSFPAAEKTALETYPQRGTKHVFRRLQCRAIAVRQVQ
jgi:hypothetical protein